MSATLISRATWTDDDGSGTTGTIIGNARLQGDIYDKIDALFSGASTFEFGGVVKGNIQYQEANKNANYTMVTTDDYIFVTASCTISLPASPLAGKPHNIKCGSGVTATIAGNGHNIDGASSFTLNPYDGAEFTYNGTEWGIF